MVFSNIVCGGSVFGAGFRVTFESHISAVNSLGQRATAQVK